MVITKRGSPAPECLDSVSDEVRHQVATFFARCAENKLKNDVLLEMRKERDRICQLLEYADYEAYWVSRFWKRIRLRILKRDCRLCLKCGGRAGQVHHRTYTVDVMKGENDSQLVSVCDGCHAVIHRDDFNNERLPDEWELVLLQKDFRNNFPPFKIDRGRARYRQKRPAGWERMNALQRAAWKEERDRQFGLSLPGQFRKIGYLPGCK